jgi:hypothetical protein
MIFQTKVWRSKRYFPVGTPDSQFYDQCCRAGAESRGAEKSNFQGILKNSLEHGLDPEPKFGFAVPWSRSRKKYFLLSNTGYTVNWAEACSAYICLNMPRALLFLLNRITA